MSMYQKKRDYCTPCIEVIKGAYAECDLNNVLGSDIRHLMADGDIVVDSYEDDETVDLNFYIEFTSLWSDESEGNEQP